MAASVGKNGMYMIGDVAKIVGLSRDALRFYEKKGIIHANKKENGYRYYSETDIYKLMYIIYYRKMNTSIKDIEEIMAMDRADTVAYMREYLSEAVKKEREEVKNHERMIARLKLARKDIGIVAEHRDCCCVKDFPKSYIIGEYPTFCEGMESWFRVSQMADGLDMAYLFTEMDCSKDDLRIKNTRVLFYKEFEKKLKLGLDLSGYKEMQVGKCIYTVVESEEPILDRKKLSAMISWGKENGMKAGNSVYVNNLSSCSWKQDPSYFLEVYMPIESLEI